VWIAMWVQTPCKKVSFCDDTIASPGWDLELRDINRSGFPLIAEETTTSLGRRMPPAMGLRGALLALPFRTLCHKLYKFSEGPECYKQTRVHLR
jgi:hypothetical protein